MGALTLKPFSDESREWELFESDSIDITDSFGVTLRLSVRENKIFLTEPWDPQIPWITDRGRLFFEGASNIKSNNQFSESWMNILSEIQAVIYFLDHFKYKSPDSNCGFLSFVFQHSNIETITLLSQIEHKTSLFQVFSGSYLSKSVNNEESFQMDSSLNLSQLAQSSTALLVNTNTRYEGYVVNLTLRQRFLKGNFNIFNIGPDLSLTIPSINVGSTAKTLISLSEGTSPFCQSFAKSTLPTVIVNKEFFKSMSSSCVSNILSTLKRSCNSLYPVSVMSDSITKAGPNYHKPIKALTYKHFSDSATIYSVNCDLSSNSIFNKFLGLKHLSISKNKTVRSQKPELSVFNQSSSNTSYFESLLHSNYENYSYFHLPTKNVFEENSTYLNSLGSFRKVMKVLNSKFGVKSNWLMLRYLSATLDQTSYFANKKDYHIISNSLSNQRSQSNQYCFIYRATPSLTNFAPYLDIKSMPFLSSAFNNKKLEMFKPTLLSFRNLKIKYWLDDFFIGGNKDSLSSNSKTLISCSKSTRRLTTNFF